METSSPQIDPARLPELYEAVCQLHGSLKLEEVIDRVLQAAIKITGADRALLWLPDRYSCYARPQLEPTIAWSINKSFDGMRKDIEQSQRSILIANTQDHPFFAHEPLATLFTSRSVLLISVRVFNEFIGVLIVDKALSLSAFTTNDLAVLESFSVQVAVAVHHAQIHRALSTFVSDIVSELRTPLISIKGYTDLLLKEMAGSLTLDLCKFRLKPNVL